MQCKEFSVLESEVRNHPNNFEPDWWRKHDAISRLQGYDFPDFIWGLAFKSEDSYMSQTYPVGTTCWFFHVETCGFFNNYCGSQPWEIIDLALVSTIEILETESQFSKLCNWDLLLERLREIQRGEIC